MNTRKILSELDLAPSKEEMLTLKKSTEDFLVLLGNELKRSKVNAEVFLGGSFAKGTLIKKKVYDVDIFVRFDWEYDAPSVLLEKILNVICKKNNLVLNKIHGSRDYFNIAEGKNMIFEVVPEAKIKRPKEARNVTDLSYFHVNYIKKNMNSKIANEIRIAKAFCHAQRVYGAESYIHGFSGYGLECLIIYYKSFEKMLRELAKAKDRIIIDPARHYKKKEEVLFEMNESKLRGPIILVDPTWKERNVLSALSNETFDKFQKAAKAFLKNPSTKFFIKNEFDYAIIESLAKKNKAEFLKLMIKTDRQAGDIAGTKLKKFADFIVTEIEKYFNVSKWAFEYGDKNSARLYIVLKSRGEIVKIGPPLKMKKHVAAFKKENKKTFEKNGMIHSRIQINFSAEEFIRRFKNKDGKKIKEMGISALNLI